jgi:hypothetical protein
VTLPLRVRPTHLRLAAFAILFIGLLLAVRIDQAARREQAQSLDQETLAESSLSPADSKRYGYQVGQLTGNVGVLASHFVQSAGSLTHGRPLAILIAITSFAAAGALLIVADRTSV